MNRVTPGVYRDENGYFQVSEQIQSCTCGSKKIKTYYTMPTIIRRCYDCNRLRDE